MLEKLTTTIVSGELLSTHLGITVRSANRILKRLHEKNLAHELPSNTSTTRGRPKSIIKFIYISQDGMAHTVGLPVQVDRMNKS